MALSSGRVGTENTTETFGKAAFKHERTGYSYRAFPETSKLLFAFGKPGGPEFTRELKYFIGSGTAARSYLLDSGGFLFQAPVAYYAAGKQWNLAPAYDRYAYPFLGRPIVPGCLQCHASKLQPLPQTLNGYAAEPFLEGGVGCERCHGPGRVHAANARKDNIVNPARLAIEERDSVCEQCHLTGAVRVLRAGRQADGFLAGERLRDHTAVFVRQGASPEMRVTSHVENLAQSACKKAVGPKLWCGTCHDPHSVPVASKRAAWFRAKCQSCHTPSACKPSANNANADCTACHMPRNPVADAEHVVYTDHSIPKLPRPRAAAPPPNAPLAAWRGNASERDLAIAYSILAPRDPQAPDSRRAFELLRKAAPQSAGDSQVLLYLADLMQRRGDTAAASDLYEQAIRNDPSQLTGSVNLGAIRMERGEYVEAIRLWRDALRKNPGLVLVRTNLALALWRIGDRAAAEEELAKAAAFEPGLAVPEQIRRELRR
jgi:hypothetical protein